jgi:hypothetical protein
MNSKAILVPPTSFDCNTALMYRHHGQDALHYALMVAGGGFLGMESTFVGSRPQGYHRDGDDSTPFRALQSWARFCTDKAQKAGFTVGAFPKGSQKDLRAWGEAMVVKMVEAYAQMGHSVYGDGVVGLYSPNCERKIATEFGWDISRDQPNKPTRK